MVDFYLVSTERFDWRRPIRCRVLRRMRKGATDDYALVELDPPLAATYYRTNHELRSLILVSRHEGRSLFPVRHWPTHVYICVPADSLRPDVVELAEDMYRVADWGAVFPDAASAAERTLCAPAGAVEAVLERFGFEARTADEAD